MSAEGCAIARKHISKLARARQRLVASGFKAGSGLECSECGKHEPIPARESGFAHAL